MLHAATDAGPAGDHGFEDGAEVALQPGDEVLEATKVPLPLAWSMAA